MTVPDTASIARWARDARSQRPADALNEGRARTQAPARRLGGRPRPAPRERRAQGLDAEPDRYAAPASRTARKTGSEASSTATSSTLVATAQISWPVETPSADPARPSAADGIADGNEPSIAYTIMSARLFMSGATISGWCGVPPKGRRRRSMNAVRMPAALAPMQSNAWLATNRTSSIRTPTISAALVYVAT